MMNTTCKSINHNFVEFWKRNKNEIINLIAQKRTSYLAFELKSPLGKHEAKNLNEEQLKLELRLYADENHCYSVYRDFYNEHIVLEPDEIFSQNNFGDLSEEILKIIYAHSEAIKESSILMLLGDIKSQDALAHI